MLFLQCWQNVSQLLQVRKCSDHFWENHLG
uniref:Uncharacterized protein n=1 Tax=Anguilla anguilla TaxID=7936 RepID=A0A0E9VD66_ANGAN